MVHCIQYTMAQEPLSSKLAVTVEVDGTYIGGKKASVDSRPGVGENVCRIDGGTKKQMAKNQGKS
jgi:hypothetical protein